MIKSEEKDLKNKKRSGSFFLKNCKIVSLNYITHFGTIFCRDLNLCGKTHPNALRPFASLVRDHFCATVLPLKNHSTTKQTVLKTILLIKIIFEQLEVKPHQVISLNQGK